MVVVVFAIIDVHTLPEGRGRVRNDNTKPRHYSPFIFLKVKVITVSEN
jgi:hypothetical protein